MRSLVSAVVLLAGVSGASAQLVNAFTETFDAGSEGWLAGTFSPLDFDASGFVSSTADISAAGPFGLTLFRGHDDFDASGDAFVGDYLTSGITTVSFDIRHDYTDALDFALRIATPGNSPGFAIELSESVFFGEWTTVTFDLDPNNPLYTPEGPAGFGFFAGVMTDVGNLQISLTPPAGLPVGTFVTFDLDNAKITPSPGAFAPFCIGLLAAARRRR